MSEPMHRTAQGARRHVRAPAPERGAAAAETAAVLPLLATVLLTLVWLLSLAVTQVRVVDAAREAARAAAREETRADAVAVALRVAPPGSDVSVSYRGDDVAVTVEARPGGAGGLLRGVPGPTLSSTAVAAREDR